MKYILNFFLLFLATLEQDVKKEEKKIKPKSEEERIIEVKYEDLQKQLEPYRKKIQAPPLGERVKATFGNIKNVAVNAFDNTVGYGVSKYQNYKTKKHFKKNPGSKKDIVYLMHGMLQNEGSQWRYARDLRKEGYKPYHLKGHHHLSRKKSADKAFKQIDNLHKETKLKNPSKRYDMFSGHSSAADLGIYISDDNRIKKYGIRPKPIRRGTYEYKRAAVQARAPAPYGIKAHTIGQRLLMPLINEKEDLSKIAGKRSAVEMDNIDPKVDIDYIVGDMDGLCTGKDVLYKKHPKIRYYRIKGKKSTHFGTSGGRADSNAFFTKLFKEGGKKYKPQKHYKMAA